jgi:hypothetical protein
MFFKRSARLLTVSALVPATLFGIVAVLEYGAVYASRQVAPHEASLVRLVADDSDTQDASADGVAAKCTVKRDLTSIDCSLSDTKGDSHQVYIEWWLDSERHRYVNSGGDGSTNGFSEESLNGDGAADHLKWKACTDVQFGGDHCSQWMNTTATSFKVLCDGVNIDNPPSAAIPPDLQPHFRCYSTDPGYPVLNECEEALAEALAGVGKEGYDAAKAGKVVLKKVPGVGWVLTGYGVVKASTQDC